MELELKHLAPYLPYGLKVETSDRTTFSYVRELVYELTGQEFVQTQISINMIEGSAGQHRLILRPLSDLTKEIEHNGEKFAPYIKLVNEGHGYLWGKLKTYNMDAVDYGCVQKLFEWHFDVFGLIENNLAINKNTL